MRTNITKVMDALRDCVIAPKMFVLYNQTSMSFK
jgi:hypothetical protein